MEQCSIYLLYALHTQTNPAALQINLIKEELYEVFIEEAKKCYQEKYGKQPKVYDVVIGDGSRKIC